MGKASVQAEWQPLRRVVVRRPGMETFFGLLEPFSSLYERVFSLEKARREHDELVETLRRGFGVHVQYLDEILLEAAGRDPEFYKELVDRAMSTMQFAGAGARRARREFALNLQLLDREQLIQVLALAPMITFVKKKGARSILPFTTLRVPLTNLFFMRDQQAVGDRGIILARLAKPQRRRETEITSFAWQALGEPPVLSIRRGTFEGGDFLPAGDFALLGTGDRTSPAAIQEILSAGVGFVEVGVVHQPRHPLLDAPDPMVNMHLDTYMNFAGERVAVGYPDMLRAARVEVYRRSDGGRYRLVRSTRLLRYLEVDHRFQVVPITTLEQLCYATNFLTVRNRRILVPDVARNAEKVLANLRRAAEANPAKYHRLYLRASVDFGELRSTGSFFPHKPLAKEVGIEATQVPLANLTGAFGGAHCLTCVLERS
ncbi:MAG: amidinotransferase [Euryarchaeota archaeon]|nr:amidinotransferase [Euryarchaeota archaeon]MDE1836803.1 amidinotransferase [Euryarchaeota archaeon]MDE1881119.1 amidinotransferase [Euryarchaeota archaeon]MDE2044787.1 amidinotransferase [Thermoplasmata archaeon]